MIDHDNNLVHVELFHVFLDQPFLHVLLLHDRIFHQQNPIEKLVMKDIVVYGQLHFLYSVKKNIYNKNILIRFFKHTNASRRVSDSSNSNIRRASCILFEISSICLRL
jgi:hypothetical protein